MKKVIVFSVVSLFLGLLFVSCNNDDNEYVDLNLNKKSVEQSIPVNGTFVMEKDKVKYEILIIDGRLISSTNLTSGNVYRAPQQIICDNNYPYTNAGISAAKARVEVLSSKYGIPCVDYYLVYNKDKRIDEVLVLYSVDEPCDWMDDVLN